MSYGFEVYESFLKSVQLYFPTISFALLFVLLFSITLFVFLAQTKYFLQKYFPAQNSAGITEGFSMCGGDFVEVYNDPSQVGKLDC